MKRISKALIVLVWLAGAAREVKSATVREYSARCAEYYARVYKVPVDLVDAVIEVESNWQPYAVSPKGAAGLMQLMPATAVRFGVRDRFRIEENIHAGTAYLAWLMHLFRGDLRLVVAAYLIGEGPILSRGLEYSSPGVYRYVSHVVRLYRSKRMARMKMHSGFGTSNESRGGK